MKKNHYKKNYKREKMQRYSKENKPRFLIEVRMLTYKDSIKKQINSDYQGGATNE